MKATTKTILAIGIFGIAMAALESAVVVYLRALYYPEGFSVAFKLIDQHIVLIEILREAATLAMLAAVGYLAGIDFKSRLAYFLLAFAVWDIFYYGWLKVFIDWPASVLEWDILFLIPFTWLGPVLAPLVCSLTMIALSLVLLSNEKPVLPITWALLFSGSVSMLFTFLQDYGSLLINNGLLGELSTILQNEEFVRIASAYTPAGYNWSVFILGEALFIIAIFVQYHGLSTWRSPATASQKSYEANKRLL